MKNILQKLLASTTIAAMVLFMLPLSVDAAITLIQTRTGTKLVTGGTTFTIAMSTNTTTGDLVVCVSTNDSPSLNGTTGLAATGMTFTKIDDKLTGDSSYDISTWYAWNITGATAPTITVTVPTGFIGGAICREYSGIQSTSDPLDKHAIAANTNGVTGTNAPNSGATATLTGSNDLVVGAAGTGDSGNTYTAGATYGNATTLAVGTTVDMGMEDKILSGSTAAQTANFTITNVSVWAAGVAAFQPTGGGGGGTTNTNHTSAYILKASAAIKSSSVSIL